MKRTCLLACCVVLMGVDRSPAQPENTTETVLTTIFQGNTAQSHSYMESLATHYESFLEHWVTEGFCTQSDWGYAAERGCLRIQASELAQIAKAEWSRNFTLAEAEFNQSLGDKNVGTYNFIRTVNVLPCYSCTFTMQITALFNLEQVSINREFFADCGNR